MSACSAFKKKVDSFLKQPFPYFPKKKKWQVVALNTLCVFPVLAIFLLYIPDPFSFRTITLFIGGFTLIAFTCSYIMFYVFPILFKRFFDAKRWTTGSFFLSAFILCLMICIADTLHDYFVIAKMYQVDFMIFSFLLINILIVFSTGIIHSAFWYFWLKNIYLHSDLQDKEDQNRKLIIRTQQYSMPDEKLITLCGNTKESLTLFPHELIYIESVKNHVHIYYKTGDRISQKTLRATLQQMEELLSDFPYLVRCHRAFIVNIYQIESTKDSKLSLISMEKIIPVSKKIKANIQNQLKLSVHSDLQSECIEYKDL